MVRVTVHVVARPTRGEAAADIGWIDAILARVDRYTIDRLSIGDVQGNHLECFSALGYAAARTNRVGLGPLVTNAATRDVGVLAAAAASLDAMSRGRAFLVLGRGDGVAHNLDLAAHTVDETAEAIVALRALLREGRCDYRGRRISLPWPGYPGERIPIYAAAGGPRMLRMAAAVCDGVYAATGCGEEDVRVALAAVAGVDRATPLDMWWVTRFGIGDSFEDAVMAASEGLSSIGNHALRGNYAERGVPEDLWQPLGEYHRRYRYARKNPLAAGTSGSDVAAESPGPSNVDLMNELGLREYFIERFGIVGTPEQVVERLRELERRGVHSVTMLANSAHELDLIGSRVLPKLAPSTSDLA